MTNLNDGIKVDNAPSFVAGEFTLANVAILLKRICGLSEEAIYSALREVALLNLGGAPATPKEFNAQRISFLEFESICPSWADPYGALVAIGLLHSSEFWEKLTKSVLPDSSAATFYAKEIASNNTAFFGRFNSYLMMSCVAGSEWKYAVLPPHDDTDTVRALLEDGPVEAASNFEELLSRMRSLFGQKERFSTGALFEASHSGAFHRDRGDGKHTCGGVAVTQLIYKAYGELLNDPEYVEILKESCEKS